jgi:hypothetical protein
MAAHLRGARYTILLVLVLAAFMAADRLWLHVYVPDEQRTTSLRESYDSFRLDLAVNLRRLRQDVDNAGARADDASAQADDARSEAEDLRDCVNSLQVYVYDFPYGEIDGSC